LKKYCIPCSTLFARLARCNSAYLTGFDSRTHGLQNYHCEHLHGILSLALYRPCLRNSPQRNKIPSWLEPVTTAQPQVFYLFQFIKYSPSRIFLSGRCLQGSLFHVVFQFCLPEIPLSILSYCEVYSKLCQYWPQ
jgi:hypothetical protein